MRALQFCLKYINHNCCVVKYGTKQISDYKTDQIIQIIKNNVFDYTFLNGKKYKKT